MATMGSSTQAGSNSLNLEILERNNYEDWRLRLETYLMSEDLWDVVEARKPKEDEEGYKIWSKRNARALYTIHSSCRVEMFPFIRGTKSAKMAWNALEQECKVLQEFDDNNYDHLRRFRSFINYVRSGDWAKAKECLGDVDARSVLLREVHASNIKGWITLHEAACGGHAHIVKELRVDLMTEEDLKTKTIDGHTALHLASGEGHVDVVKELPVAVMGELQDKHDDTALHIAVKKEKLNVVKELVLLMRPEDLKIKNKEGNTALHLAVSDGKMPIVKALVTKEKGQTNHVEDDFERYKPFGDSVAYGYWGRANECLRKLHDDDDRCSAITALHFPYYDGSFGRNALHIAAEMGHLDVTIGLISLLKTRHEDHLNLKTTEDFRSFGSSIPLGESEEILMENATYMVEQYDKTIGSCLEIQNSRGHTPLITAVWNDRFEIARELAKSMRPEGFGIKERNGYNALHLASKKGKMPIVKMLIPFMKPEALLEKDNEGRTALSLAMDVLKDEEVYEMAKYLTERNDEALGIPCSLAHHGGRIPVVEAAHSRKWKMARYLYSLTPLQFLKREQGSSFICYCISNAKNIDLVWHLLDRNPDLALTESNSSNISPMSELSRMSYAFLSGSQLTWLQRWIYDYIDIGEVAQVNIDDICINVVSSDDDHQNKRDNVSKDIGEVAQVNINDICINVASSHGDLQNKWDDVSKATNLFRRIFAGGLKKISGIRSLYEMKQTHRLISEILLRMAKVTDPYSWVFMLYKFKIDTMKTSIFKAIQQGHFEFVTHICKGNSKFLDQLLINTRDKDMFHFAIESRLKEVYSLIYEIKEEDRRKLAISYANKDNCLLHCAANLPSLPYFEHVQDAALQMQRELQWFKEVESVVPSELYEHRDPKNDMTARQLFTKNHTTLLKDAEISIKGTATSCTVVGALIITMMFAAAFTVPGGNNSENGYPLFLKQKLFKAYIISDTISLASSTSSVITFLGLLTSRYAENDFLISLPTKMMLDLITLFCAIVSMVITFSCALILMHDGEAWIVAVSILFASLPVILYVWLLFPLLINTFNSTYRPGLFDKKKK